MAANEQNATRSLHDFVQCFDQGFLGDFFDYGKSNPVGLSFINNYAPITGGAHLFLRLFRDIYVRVANQRDVTRWVCAWTW
jgi:hypothetical protein